MNDSDDAAHNAADRNPGGPPPSAPGSLEVVYLDFEDYALALRRGVASMLTLGRIAAGVHAPAGPRTRVLPIFEATVALGREAVRVAWDPTQLPPESAVYLLAPLMTLTQNDLFDAVEQLRSCIDLIEAKAKAEVAAFNRAFRLHDAAPPGDDHGPDEDGRPVHRA